MSQPSPDEFLPLAFFPWDTRPETVCRSTSRNAQLHPSLAEGDIRVAAARLKVTAAKLNRMVRRCTRLRRLRDDLGGA